MESKKNFKKTENKFIYIGNRLVVAREVERGIGKMGERGINITSNKFF